MIIFGWGHQTNKNLGPTFRNHCSNCNNDGYWILTKITVSFTLFFIPIFPYSIKYFLACPVCKYGVTLDSEKAEKLRRLIEASQSQTNKQISEDECMRVVRNENVSRKHVESMVVERNSGQGSSYCSGCGTKIISDINFCGNCGIKVS